MENQDSIVAKDGSEEENNNKTNVTVLKLVATGKRALSDSYSSCEPIPKKLRVELDTNDTNSTNSCCSEE